MSANTPTYQALLYYAPGDVRLERVPFAALKAGEVRVRIGAATTCGTDRKTFRRGHPVLIKEVPAALGHEMAGTVVEVAADVAAFTPGDRVAIANSGPCGECFFCRKGESNLCEHLIFLNGAYAEFIVVPSAIVRANMHKIPAGMDFAVAALTEPLACVMHACERLRIATGETVAIIGTGPMAFLFAQVVRASGAVPILIGRNILRLKLARDNGTAVLNSQDDDYAVQVRTLTEGYGADVAIEAVGQPETWRQAVTLVRKGGRVCLYGGCARGTEFALDTYRVHYEEISVFGVFHYTPAVFKKALSWLAEGRIATQLFLSEERTLADLPRLLTGEDPVDALKYVIRP